MHSLVYYIRTVRVTEITVIIHVSPGLRHQSPGSIQLSLGLIHLSSALIHTVSGFGFAAAEDNIHSNLQELITVLTLLRQIWAIGSGSLLYQSPIVSAR